MSDDEITDSVFMPGDPSLTWFEYERTARDLGHEPTQAAFMQLRDGYWMNARTAEFLRKMWTE